MNYYRHEPEYHPGQMPISDFLRLNNGYENIRGAVGQTLGRPPRISGTFDPAQHQRDLRAGDNS
ncbi:MAG: hypothetical protein V2A63_04300 [Patescibacteria group bacterium]